MSKLQWAAFAVLGVLVTQTSSNGAPKPNVIVILIDDMGQRDCGCYGSKYYRTPNIDALAKSGVKFNNGYSACPVCSPSRAAVLTGRYPQRVGITDWLPGKADGPGQKMLRPKLPSELPLTEVTLAKTLHNAGYTTASIGKWHLGGEGHDPTKYGFDVNVAGDQSGTPYSYFAPFANKKRTMPGLEKAPEGEYLTDRLTDEAIKFVTANKSKPFFLYLPHYGVHTPLKAKPEVVAKYKLGGAGSQGNPTYAAMVEAVDDSVGRIMKTLDELKLAENTVVIFTSDNGGLATLEGLPQAPTYNGPNREGKGYLYEGGIKVPFIVRGPGVAKPGTNSDAVVSGIDIMPTVVALAEVKSESKLDGVSFVPALRGEKIERDAIYWHYPHYANQGSKPGGAVRSGDWKLIEYYENGRQELFDVKKDLSESRNLAADQPAVVKELAAKLSTWRKEVGAKMPTPNPDYRPNPQADDGTIVMHARTATVHGVMLRFEPLPHKNTLGFWVNANDYATFDFTVVKPGKFTIEALQGCGRGSGGSTVEFTVGESTATLTVKDTGGFQAFETVVVGEVKIEKAGMQTLTVKAKKKPGAAVMDLRQVTLKPAK